MKIDKSICYVFFDFCLDVEKQQLFKSGQPVQLTHKAFQILQMLVQNSGQITKKEDIFSSLWFDSFVEDSNLTQHVYILRKVLGQKPDGEAYIETVSRQGYRFNLSPEQISVTENSFNESREHASIKISDFSNAQADTGSLPNDTELNSAKPADFNDAQDFALIKNTAHKPANSQINSASAGNFRKPHVFLIAALLFLTSLAAIGIYYMRSATPLASRAENIKSIAVLPFQPIGENVDREKLGFGMADAVITRLSKLQQVNVRPTSAIFRFTDKPADAVSAGRKLGVDAILEGTIQSDGERIRVTVQMVRVGDGKSLWAESFQEKISDIFAVQDSISAKVASALSINLTQQQAQLIAQRATNSAEAFQSYQLGIYFWNKRTREDLLRAVEYFRQAVEKDPNYAQAFAGLADSYSMLGFYGYADESEMKNKARAAAQTALGLNDSLSEAHVALAMAFAIDKDYKKSQELLQKALILSPNSSAAHLRYGWILLQGGKLDEAAGQMRLAQELDPLSGANNRALCNVLVSQRKYADAVNYCEKLIEISPEIPAGRSALARAYFFNGQYADAFKQLEMETGEYTDYARGKLALYYAKTGRSAEAEKLYAELKQKNKSASEVEIDLTQIAYALGKKEESLFYFKKMLKYLDSDIDLELSLKYDPNWDEFKSDSQFASLFSGLDLANKL